MSSSLAATVTIAIVPYSACFACSIAPRRTFCTSVSRYSRAATMVVMSEANRAREA
ncbi:MAG TPA: hypothetical protein VJB66_03345 [Candidatus Nanoarchaeia archaeon]|nr:hypothetical protein [Candidatus Nanoarchaeia archaeon]